MRPNRPQGGEWGGEAAYGPKKPLIHANVTIRIKERIRLIDVFVMLLSFLRALPPLLSLHVLVFSSRYVF